MNRTIISTADAPAAIGTYSQAVRVGDTVYISGQIPLDPATKELVSGSMEAQVRRVFENLKAIATAAGGSLDGLAPGYYLAAPDGAPERSRPVGCFPGDLFT